MSPACCTPSARAPVVEASSRVRTAPEPSELRGTAAPATERAPSASPSEEPVSSAPAPARRPAEIVRGTVDHVVQTVDPAGTNP